jgi:hypothetical protein
MDFIDDDVVVVGREMTADEVAEREQWALDALKAEQVAADELAAKESAKESAFEKLAGWGLTPDEIAAIITP